MWSYRKLMCLIMPKNIDISRGDLLQSLCTDDNNNNYNNTWIVNNLKSVQKIGIQLIECSTEYETTKTTNQKQKHKRQQQMRTHWICKFASITRPCWMGLCKCLCVRRIKSYNCSYVLWRRDPARFNTHILNGRVFTWFGWLGFMSLPQMLWKVTVFLRPRYAHIFAFVIWQTVALKMNQTGGKAPSTPRLSEYATNALEKIRKELRMFSIGDVHNISNSINGQAHITSHNSLIPNQVECDLNALITHLVATGYTEEQAIAFIKSNGRSELPGEWKKIVWSELYRRLCCRFYCLFFVVVATIDWAHATCDHIFKISVFPSFDPPLSRSITSTARTATTTTPETVPEAEHRARNSAISTTWQWYGGYSSFSNAWT